MRFLLILSVTFVCLAALIVALVYQAPLSVLSSLGTALGLLVPAFLDASMVEARRRNPTTRAVMDDVRPPAPEPE